jgi:hypothetical protein
MRKQTGSLIHFEDGSARATMFLGELDCRFAVVASGL